ncbi:MAG: TIGR04150 pseudo-rSAM protein [Bacteroidales bacterium]|nr:TIGR04150 pseudo-rSAM protein [Bacteroidales bacterium]
MKNYWFIIASKVYFVEKNGKVLLYHTENGNFMKVENEKIIVLLQKMHEKTNLGVLEMDENFIKDIEIQDFINESVSKQICKLVEKNENEPKPVQLLPILNLQRDVEKLQKEGGRSVGEDVLKYLSEIKFCLLDKNKILDFDLLKKVLKTLKFAPNKKIIFTGTNIFEYPHFKELLTFLKSEQIEASFSFHYRDANIETLKVLSDFKKKILINFPVNFEILTNLLPFSDEKTTFDFSITSEEDYAETEKILESSGIKNYHIKACYTGENDTFLKANIFLNEDDILNGNISQRMIFAHQKLNTHFFGALYISPNGDVRANPNTAVLGNLQNKSLLQLAEKELFENSAWLQIRDKEPCSNCLYQYLCPSPSNYESAIGKFNLCKVH